MKSKFFKMLSFTIALACCFSISVFAEMKTKDGTSNGVLWNQATGETTIYDLSNSQIFNTILDPIPKIDVSITPMFVTASYTQSTTAINYKGKYVGFTRVDNSKNLYGAASLEFTATDSGSITIEATASFETATELNLVLAKVQGTVTVGGSYSRAWEKSHQYGTTASVPKGKIGKVTAYIPTTKSTGSFHYYSTGTNSAGGAIVPSQNSWNFVVEIPSA